MCPSVENPDMVFLETGDSRGLTHSRLAECGSRLAIKTGSNHSNRVVSPSRGFSVDMHQVAPASDRSVCYEVQQETTSVSLCHRSMTPCLGI